MAKKKVRRGTPFGEIAQGFIQKPSKKYSSAPFGEYVLTLVFTGEEENFDSFKGWCDRQTEKAVQAMIDEDPDNASKTVVPLLRPETDKENKPTGRWLFRASQTADWGTKGGKKAEFRKLDVFTRAGNPFPAQKQIGKGSTASASFTLGNPYESDVNGGIVGVKAYLQAVMIEKFVEYTGPDAGSYGFDTDDDYDDSDLLDTAGYEEDGGTDFGGGDAGGAEVDPDDAADF